MNRKIEIRFWFEATDEFELLTYGEVDELEEMARNSIFKFITQDGYTSGELCESIGDVTFYGWWEYQISNAK